MRRLVAVAAAVALVGCTIGGASSPRPSDLEDDWYVGRLRLLGVQAEPPEARPGELVRFSALFADPEGVADTIVWIACPPDDASSFGCTVDFSALSDNPTPEELAAAGVIGVEPLFPPTYTPDAALLDGLDEHDRLEGVEVTVQVSAFPAGSMDDPSDVDFDEVEAGYKRLVVSEATTPNHNPEIAAFTVDGVAVAPSVVVELDPDQLYEIGVELPEATVEAYEYENSDRTVENRTEQPYVTWYATDGALFEEYTLYPYTEASWASPAASGATGTWYAVVRDRRGGMSWRLQSFAIR